jgi:asparagine synthase (glutamine-hydrolysing)
VSGIVAICSKGAPISRNVLEAGTVSLSHRGPDATAIWIAPHERIGLGHTYLDINDGGVTEQPMASGDGRIRMIMDGELYVSRDVRKDLEARGHACDGDAGDSEIALHLYEEFGPRCLQHLRGKFAFILWDESENVLFAARDRFGLKPLLYTRAGDMLYLASESKGLFSMSIPAEWDHESFYQHLFVCTNMDRTLFKNVYQVPPGHYIWADRNGLRIVRYWDFDFRRTDAPLDGTEDELVDKLEQALNESVHIRLRSNGPVGCYLSGGIDSSAVLGIAAKQSGNPVNAFTVCFDLAAFNEEDTARSTAHRAGARFTPVPVSHHDLAHHFTETIEAFEMLAENANWVARYLMSRAAHASGLKAAMDGEGADGLFAGSSFAVQDMPPGGGEDQRAAAQRRNREASMEALLTKHGFGVEFSSTATIDGALGSTPTFLRNLAVNRSIFHALIHSDFSEEFKDRDPFGTFIDQFDIEGQLEDRHPVHQGQYLRAKSIFLNYILAAERLDMAHSIEVKVPFLDCKVAELSRNMPATWLVRGMKGKCIFRKAVRPYVSDAVYRRAKYPFFAPPITVMEGDRLLQMVQDVLRSRVLKDVGFFDGERVIRLLDGLPGMDDYLRMMLDPILLMILSACILQCGYIGRELTGKPPVVS